MNVDTRFSSAAEAAERYARTPVYSVADAERLARAGGTYASLHIGHGVFVTVCRCGAAHYAYGTAPVHATIGPHMVSEHGDMVAGINLGLLP